jgi:hypothetical protein
MSVAGPGPASQDPLRAHLASLFGSEEDADCEVAFVREGDPDGEPMHVQPAHKLVIRGMCAFFKAQVCRGLSCGVGACRCCRPGGLPLAARPSLCPT